MVLGAAVVWAIWTGSPLVTDDVLPFTLKSRAPFIRFLLIGVLLEVVLTTRPRGLIAEKKHVSRFLRAAERHLGVGPPLSE